MLDQTARRRTRLAVFLLGWAFSSFALQAQAEQVYQEPEDFLQEAFGGTAPAAKALWVTGGLREQATEILLHKPKSLRTRYWRDGNKTAWLLDELGKERDISFGVVIDNHKIAEARVLVYRENRGYEITSNAFSAQFTAATLQPDLQLDRRIDGITGATLSVNAMKRVSALALLYHQHALKKE